MTEEKQRDEFNLQPTLLAPDHPFVVALRNLDLGGVRSALDADPSLVDARVTGDHTLKGNGTDETRSASGLQFAAFHGHADLARLLITYDARINGEGHHATDASETSAIVLAAWQGGLETLRVVLAASSVAKHGQALDAALSTAAGHGGNEEAELLLQHGARHTIYTAANLGDAAAVLGILRDDPDAVDRCRNGEQEGRTPLQEAVAFGQAEVANLLVERGACATPDVAAALGMIEPMERLLTSDPTASTKLFGTQPLLMWAIVGGQVEMIRLLLRHGADPEGADQWGVTPLRTAAGFLGGQGPQIVELLLRAGADVNRVSRHYSPLDVAVSTGNLAVARALVHHGVDVNQPTWKGQTPLHQAVEQGDPSQVAASVDLLLQAGADQSLVDDSGKQPRDLAAARQLDEAVRLFHEHGS